MKKELTNQLLSLYKGSDQLRPAIMEYWPIEWDNKKWCASTDGVRLILIPENDNNKLELPPFKEPGFASVMPVFDLDINVDINSLKSRYDNIELIDKEKTTPCDRCDGLGEFEHEGYDYECKHCNGKGDIPSGILEKVKDDRTVFRFGNCCIKNNFIRDLILVLDLTECKVLKIRYLKLRQMVAFELDNNIIVGIMPIEGDFSTIIHILN